MDNHNALHKQPACRYCGAQIERHRIFPNYVSGPALMLLALIYYDVSPPVFGSIAPIVATIITIWGLYTTFITRPVWRCTQCKSEAI